MRTNVTVNEDILRRIFGRFGVLSEIAIRLSLIDKLTNVRKGYAFIRYEVNSNGVLAAVAAEKEVNNSIRDNVHYHVELSRVLANNLRLEGHLDADARDSLDTARQMMSCGGRSIPMDSSEHRMIATRETAAFATSPMNPSFHLPTTGGMMNSMSIPQHATNHHHSIHYSEQYHHSYSHPSHPSHHHQNPPHNYCSQNQLHHNHGQGDHHQQYSISPSSSSSLASSSSSSSSSYGGYVITHPATTTVTTTSHYQQY